MLPSIRCSECEEDMGLNQVICCIPLDVSEFEEDVELDEVICSVLLDCNRT